MNRNLQIIKHSPFIICYNFFQPSSSSEAAKLLLEAGTAPTGFIGFGFQMGSPGYVPVSQSLDDVDTSLDADIQMVLRKLSKKDATTKVKVQKHHSRNH